MSGGLIWTDETNKNTPIEVIWALRYLVAFRTSLMLGKPREELRSFWEYGLSLFPKWVGFRSERRQPAPDLMKEYRRGSISLRKCLRDMDREMKTDEEQSGESIAGQDCDSERQCDEH
jgi:hypothetical protein